MRFWFKATVACILLGVIWGCSNRKRSNPLDPLNPDTGGKPTGLRVVTEKHTAIIEWHALSVSGGFNIYRRMEGQDSYETLASVSSGVYSYQDSDLPYNQEVAYRISALASGYESPWSDSVAVIPGPHNYWLVDTYFGEVFKLTYDVRHVVAESIESPYPVGIAADSVSGSVWVADLIGLLFKLSGDGEALLRVEGLYDPSHVVFDPINRYVWVSDSSGTQVVRYNNSGNILGRTGGFQRIRELSHVSAAGGCWVADGQGREIVFISDEDEKELSIDEELVYPTAVSYFHQGDWLWAADSLRMLRIWPDGRVEETLTLNVPIHTISVDQSTGDCWVVTILNDGEEDEILKVNAIGEIIVRARGFYIVQDLVANDSDGGCIVADSGNRRIVKLSGDGEIMTILAGFGVPSYLASE
jgi:hypothetical protein